MIEQNVCTKCREPISVHSNQFGSLKLSCGCDKERDMKVNRKLPEDWL